MKLFATKQNRFYSSLYTMQNIYTMNSTTAPSIMVIGFTKYYLITMESTCKLFLFKILYEIQFQNMKSFCPIWAV